MSDSFDHVCAADDILSDNTVAVHERPMLEQMIALPEFISQFGGGLLDAIAEQNPAVFRGQRHAQRELCMDGLLRQPFEEQRDVVRAVCQLLVDQHKPAAVINGEMGTGKTIMGIAAAAVLHHEGFPRCLVLSPPHLVYKWRREIMQTVPGAKVWVLNGSDTLRKLLAIRAMHTMPATPEFFILGRVRMRMGFNWEPKIVARTLTIGDGNSTQHLKVASCPHCGELLKDGDGEYLKMHHVTEVMEAHRKKCPGCKEALWSLVRGRASSKTRATLVLEALTQIPTIGEKSAQRLLDNFGEDMLSDMLEDNFHEFINLMGEDGELVFSDRQASRMERYLGNNEVSFGQGGYQPTEFIKRYLPRYYFGTMLVDEGHEYKNEGSAQGQALGVLASQVRKTILLTGTLMGGYADDLFHLLHRIDSAQMIEDGFVHNQRGSIGPAADAFMRQHGVLIETYKSTVSESRSHRTAKAEHATRQVSKAPGFGPKGIMRYVVPITAFLKLKEISGNVLPPYEESFVPVAMDEVQASQYGRLSRVLSAHLKTALQAGDHSLLGVVLNSLLAWPDTAFREELVYHPHKRILLASVPALYGDSELTPKERELVRRCKAQRARGRRVLVYTTYTATRDTTARLKRILDEAGFKTSVLKSTVEASKREDWVSDQVERGVNVIITNPELVKTGLDLLDFPAIMFMQSGYNVYTMLQAARRSWRIGQRQPVEVMFLGYGDTAQETCLKLMGKKIAVSQSTSGDMPDSGLDVLNQDGDSIEVALAKQLMDKEAK